jgi:hypothetical protein
MLCDPAHATLTASELVDALKSKYTTAVHLGTVSSGHPFQADPWDPVSKQAINMITRLNQASRIYLKTDALDQQVGLQVLEKVKDDVDCSFICARTHP